MMKKEIPNKRRFTRSTAANENNYGILRNPLHIKSFYVEIYVGTGGHL
jgi:hypothetical protein